MISIVFLYALLALTFVFAKKVVAVANPFFIIGFRMAVAGMLLLAYQALCNIKSIRIKRRDYWLFFQTTLFHIYLSFILEFWALQYITALKTTIIYAATPFIAALLSYVLLRERLSLQKCMGIVIGLCGLLPVMNAAGDQTQAFAEMTSVSLPEIILLVSVACSAYAWFLVKRLMHKGYPLSVINGYAMLIGGILSFATTGVFEGFNHPVNDWPSFLVWIGLLIIVANIVVYNLYGWLLRYYSMTLVTFAGFLCPIFGALFEWLLMDGAITWHHAVSFCLVSLGLYIFYRNEFKMRFIEPS